MRIDGEQEDIVFEPLSSFLFKCTFTAPERYKKLLTDSILEKLKYSVVSLNIPKLTEKNLEAISYGSFALPFPYYSTGQKEMSIDFFETDDMLISRVFYVLQSKKRWSAKTIFRMSDAELFLHVEIYPQRNAKGYKYPMKNPVFVRDYGLIMKGINPPEFSRTGEVTLLKTKIEFNTIESDYYGEKGRTYQDSGIDPTKEKHEWDKQKAEAAFIDTEQMGDRIAEQFAEWMKEDMERAAREGGPSTGGAGMYYAEQARTAEERKKLKLPEKSSRDFILDNNELEGNYAKYSKARKDKAVSKDEFARISLENLKRLQNAYSGVNEDFAKTGTGLEIRVEGGDVNSWTSHGVGSGANASHTLSQKMDVILYKDGVRVDAGMLTESEFKTLYTVMDENGLAVNFESRDITNKKKMWLDTQLKSALGDADGKVVEKKFENTWAGDREVAVMETVDGKDQRKYTVDVVTGEIVDNKKRTRYDKNKDYRSEAEKQANEQRAKKKEEDDVLAGLLNRQPGMNSSDAEH